MIVIQQVIAADTKYPIQVPQGLVTFDVHNDSPYNMAINFDTDSGLGSAEYYMSPHSILYGLSSADNGPGYSVGGSRGAGQIFVYTQTPIGGTIPTSSAPANSLTIMGYPVGRAPQSTVSLNRFVGVGGTVTTSQVNLIQDGSPINTTFIEATHAGSLTSNVVMDNSGNLLLSSNPRTGGGGIASPNTQLVKVDATNNLISLGDPSINVGNVQLYSQLLLLAGTLRRFQFFQTNGGGNIVITHNWGVVPDYGIAFFRAGATAFGTAPTVVPYVFNMTTTQATFAGPTGYNGAVLLIGL